MTLTLSKRVPARTKTLTARWCRADFMEMSPKWRAIRAKFRSPMKKCYWCKHPFADGEMMALAAFEEKIGNKILCQTCATELLSSEPPTDVERRILETHDG